MCINCFSDQIHPSAHVRTFHLAYLDPENFLHLQAHAKAYMLDPEHPARQACIRSHGKGDTDMVKLQLFRCVYDFLNAGAGDRFFGEDAPGWEAALILQRR